MWVRIIMYIEDMLIMAESEAMLRDHIKGVVYLLENLGFVINDLKSLLEPRRPIDILGKFPSQFTIHGTQVSRQQGQEHRPERFRQVNTLQCYLCPESWGK